jgi:MFS transporter, CP family, cyanate transporter
MTRRPDTALMLAGVVLVALNLTPAAVSTGTVLLRLQPDLGLPDSQVALLTALPLLAFAVFCALAKSAARIFGIHRVMLMSVIAITVGTFARALADHNGVFLFLSALAYAGAATAATLLPTLVRRHFPGRVPSLTALCSAATALAAVAAAALTRPITHAEGGWRTGLAVWGILGVVAAIPWLRLVQLDRHHRHQRGDLSALRVLRAPVARALAVLLGLEALQSGMVIAWLPSLCDQRGYTPDQAGLLLAVVPLIGYALGFVVPAAAMWGRGPARVALGVIAAEAVGFVGLLLHPHALAVPAALLLGVGSIGTTVLLVLIGLRSRTPGAAVALVNATHAVGYLLAGVGALGIGWLHLATGGWRWPLGVLALLAVPELLLLAYLARPAYVEEQVPALAGAEG